MDIGIIGAGALGAAIALARALTALGIAAKRIQQFTGGTLPAINLARFG